MNGNLKIEWAAKQMPVLASIQKRFEKEKPFKGLTIGACLHVTSETAVLMITLKAGGADVFLCASNPLSTQDTVAESLNKDFDIPTYAKHGEDNKSYYEHLNIVLDKNPNITMDDGGDLVTLLHTKRTNLLKNILGSSEETTTGVIRLKAMEKDGVLKVPVIAVNDSMTKHMFDNRYGTGQSTVDGVIRATNILLAGKRALVVGYGWCGRGIAQRLKGMGAQVTIAEVDEIKTLEAVMDGFVVRKVGDAIQDNDLVITATGNKHVLNTDHFKIAKDGIILANSGHFNVEIDMAGLEKMANGKRELRPSLDEYVLNNGKLLYVLGGGRLVNLAAAEGHPAEVMDMSFANQALAAEYFVEHKGKLENKVHVLPKELDDMVAGLKLKAMGVSHDSLTAEQKKYLSSWTEGT